MYSEAAIISIDHTLPKSQAQEINTSPTGFPSPAADHFEEPINIFEYLTPNPTATFFVKYNGQSMKDAGILPGSILVIDRSLPLKNNAIVLAVINGEFYVKHYMKQESGTWLMPANEDYNPILVSEDMEFSVWGVVAKIITDVDCIG